MRISKKELSKKELVKRVERLIQQHKYLSQSTYNRLKWLFDGGELMLDDFNKTVRLSICKKVFYYKFLKSCSNAKIVRCGKRDAYKDIKFLLGEERGMVRRLYKCRPDLVAKGIKITEDYISNGFKNAYAPSMHRPNRNLSYDWDNIDIVSVKDHHKVSQQEREQDRLLIKN